MDKALILLALLSQTMQMGIVNANPPATGGSNTFALIQQSSINTFSGTTGSIPVASTGTGHIGIVTANGGISSAFITSVTGGGTWVTPPAGCQSSNGNGSVSCAYTLSTTSGATSITVNSGTTATYKATFWEYSFTGGPCSLDATGNQIGSPSGGTMAGVPLTLSGSSDIILQMTTGITMASINAPYGHFQATGSFADSINTTSGTAPTWNYSAQFGGAPSGAIAIKC